MCIFGQKKKTVFKNILDQYNQYFLKTTDESWRMWSVRCEVDSCAGITPSAWNNHPSESSQRSFRLLIQF